MSEFQPRFLSDYQASNFSISTVDLTFELNEHKTRVINIMRMTQHNLQQGKLVLDGEHLKLMALYLNDELVSPEQYELTESFLAFDVKEKEFTLKIITEINPVDNTALEGLFKSGGAYCTQCEAEGFRRISYYLDRPDVMATFTTTVIADKKNYPYLLSNGNKIKSGELVDNKHFVTWHDPFPKPSYLFALVAGEFDVLRDVYITGSGREVHLEIFVDKGNVNKAHHAMASLKHSMVWDEKTFGLEYDLDIYMIVAVDFFNMGAMENKGLNVFNSKFVLADETSATDTDYFNVEAVIAHEYFHNWTGNRVTCRDWFQLSLKEGLTVFRDQQFSADMHSAAVTRIKNVRALRSMQFPEDAGPMAHPIRPEKVLEMNNFYTLTVYEKGAEVIRMIHTLLGQNKFRAGIDLYFKRFDGMAVTCDDFVNAMADGSGIELSQFKRWYEQSGTPQLLVEQSFDSDKNEFNLTINQQNNGKEDLHIPVAIELIDSNEHTSTSHLLELTKSAQTWTFSGFKEQPILALLTGFSAPVKAEFQQTDKELQEIIMHAQDAFCRWDAGEKQLTTYILNTMATPSLQLPESFLGTFEKIITGDVADAFKAEQLTLPNFDELIADLNDVDPQQLLEAINKVKLQLAIKFETLFEQLYRESEQPHYENHGEAIGKRALRNVCLSYLTVLKQHHPLLTLQYQQADNMTDSLAALACSAKYNAQDFDQVMDDFAQRWSDNTLVMDKWFAIHASFQGESIYHRLAKLLAHPLFSLKNPNRARALIGAFAMNNPKYFHCRTGRGYQFLAEQIMALNVINPQVASRLITPLIQYKVLDQGRQKLIKVELEKIANLKALSRDLKEKLDAALK